MASVYLERYQKYFLGYVNECARALKSEPGAGMAEKARSCAPEGLYPLKLKPYANLAKNVLTSNLKRLHFPYKLTYAVTSACNYRCKTCNIWQKRPENELSLKEIQEFFRNSHEFSWIDLTGGEIFLRKDLLPIVEAILSHCRSLLLLHFPTNGYLTDTIVRSVDTIMSWKPEKLIITVSMDGDEAVNDSVRGIKGGWRRQMETFKQLRSLPGVKTVLGMTLSAYNADQMEIAFRAAQETCPRLGYRDFHVNAAHISGHYYGNDEQDLYQGRQETVIEEVNKYMRHRGRPRNPVDLLEKAYLKRFERYLRTGQTPIRCQALNASCFINPSGDVYPCSVYDRKLGSLRESGYDLSAVWNSEISRRLQKEIWEYDCPQCWTPCEAYQSILGSWLKKDRPWPKK